MNEGTNEHRFAAQSGAWMLSGTKGWVGAAAALAGGAGPRAWCRAQVSAGVPHVFTPPRIPARHIITTLSMSSFVVLAIL